MEEELNYRTICFNAMEVMKRAAELYDFEVMMIALNHTYHDGNESSEEHVVPYSAKKGIGIVAMKVIRPKETIESLDPQLLVRYALSLKDFHMANIGMASLEVLKSNLAIIRDFSPLDGTKMDELRLALQPFYKGNKLEWMHPAYLDGWHSHIHLA